MSYLILELTYREKQDFQPYPDPVKKTTYIKNGNSQTKSLAMNSIPYLDPKTSAKNKSGEEIGKCNPKGKRRLQQKLCLLANRQSITDPFVYVILRNIQIISELG